MPWNPSSATPHVSPPPIAQKPDGPPKIRQRSPENFAKRARYLADKQQTEAEKLEAAEAALRNAARDIEIKDAVLKVLLSMILAEYSADLKFRREERKSKRKGAQRGSRLSRFN